MTAAANFSIGTKLLDPKPKGILFDLDGVLINSEPVHEFTLLELSERFGRRFKDAELLPFKGLPERSMARAFQRIFPNLTLSIDEIIGLRLEQLRRHFDRIEMIPGALSFLQKARAEGFHLGLTTSAPRSMQVLACETFALSSYFEAVITGDDIELGKPDPEPYVRTAAKLALQTNECMVVEDAVNGVLSGKAAGCFVVAITTSFPPVPLESAGADLIVPSFSALEANLFAKPS